MVVGLGFEPRKAMPADLQSAPVGHFGTPPQMCPSIMPKKLNIVNIFIFSFFVGDSPFYAK